MEWHKHEKAVLLRPDDLESITDIHLDISPIDGGWESIRYYVDDGEGSMSFYCAKWVVLDMKKKHSPRMARQNVRVKRRHFAYNEGSRTEKEFSHE